MEQTIVIIKVTARQHNQTNPPERVSVPLKSSSSGREGSLVKPLSGVLADVAVAPLHHHPSFVALLVWRSKPAKLVS